MDTLLQTLASQGPLVAMLLFFLLGFVKRWWVLGWTYDEKAKSHDEYKALALKLLNVAERAVDR